MIFMRLDYIYNTLVMKPKYITPRIAIALISSQGDVEKLQGLVEARHKQYHFYFNLTMLGVGGHRQMRFKWRGPPFSMTETLKIMVQVDAFLRANLANSAILCVSDPTMEQYALFVLKTYLHFCVRSVQPQGGIVPCLKIQQLAEKVIQRFPYLSREIDQIYRTISIEAPPLKYLQALVIEPQDSFVPIVEIFTEGRYNDFEPVYTHDIEEDLAVYYLDLNRPLQTGIGRKYYDGRPETKYFKQPVLVAGDVKIKVYSYEYLTKVHEFTVGFNTSHIDELNQTHPGLLIFGDDDFYQQNKERSTKLTVKVQFSDYCEGKCKKHSNCQACKDLTKKIAGRYSDSQGQLAKLHRVRTKEEVHTLLSF